MDRTVRKAFIIARLEVLILMSIHILV